MGHRAAGLTLVLTFNEAEHRYFWNGKPVPNVTRVLAPLTDYSMVSADTLELARQKGVAVHKMVELWAKGALDVDTLPDWMKPVYAHWLKFVDDTGFEVIASERRVYHPIYRYAGTLDLRGRMTRSKLRGEGILDVKRSFMAGDVIGLQTVAYEAADEASNKCERTQWRAALRLREDGPYRLETYDDKSDFNVFLSLLTIHNWKEARK